jgi:hypothetical protein
MTMLLAGEGPTLEQLRRQLAAATVASREHAGNGLFTSFAVPAELRLSFNTLQLEGVAATITGLQNGAGFVLFVRDGVLDFLEGFTHREEWPAEVTEFTLRHETPEDVLRRASVAEP